MWAGAISAMYIGDTIAARPIAKPPTMRQAMKSQIVMGKAEPRPAIRNSTAAISITRLRP